MDGLIVLAALVLLGIPVAVIVLLIGHFNLKARIGRLEQELRRLQRAPGADRAAPEPATAPEAPIPAAPPAPAVEASPWQRAMPTAATPTAPADTPAAAPDQNRPLVLTSDRLAALTRWLRDNWVYAVSALSLALAGVFLVQYGVEKGLLPPAVRVVLAILFGIALIVAGEWLRRRQGDGEWAATAYLPSVFSGAGLVSIFAGILAARQMYALIGHETAFAGFLATAVLAVVLGWFYGPLLAAVGLLGAAAAPFLVAGPGGATPWLYGYFALIAATGLAVDAVRRWAWVSVLALVLGYGGGWLMFAGGAGANGWALMLVALALLATALPLLRLLPDHQAPTILEALVRRDGLWPNFPVRLAGGAVLASSLALLVLPGAVAAESLLAFAALTALALALLLWADRARGLADLALLPAAAFLLRLLTEAASFGPLAREFAQAAIALRAPETAAPWTVTALLALAVLITLASAVRALRGGVFPLGFGLGAVLTAPLAAVALELFWQPSPVLGAYPWALQVIALAGLMVGLALWFARADGDDRRRAAHATLSALSLIALALFLVTTKSALTLALAVLAVVAAGLDRRFRLPEMGLFVQIGVAVLGWRLTVDPGLDWALEAALSQVLLAYAGVIAAMVAGWVLLAELPRPMTRAVLESAAFGFAALFANVLITRWLTGDPGSGTTEAPAVDWTGTHWGLALNAMPWLVLMLVQLYRMRLGGPLRLLRAGIAGVAGLLAAAGLLWAAGPANPLFALGSYDPTGLVRGPWVLDTLLVAYALPGLILALAGRRLPGLPPRLRHGFIGSGAALLALYAGLEIRRLWQGDYLGAPGVTQGELYSYTLALMLTGAGLLYQAIARRDARLRRAAMAVIALTVAKVFLIDAAGLTGLTRVFSFLGLGLSLAGLAWLNRWAAGTTAKPAPES